LKRLFSRATSYTRGLDDKRRWLLLRGYVFWNWLKLPCNHKRAKKLSSILKPSELTINTEDKEKEGRENKEHFLSISKKRGPDEVNEDETISETGRCTKKRQRTIVCDDDNPSTLGHPWFVGIPGCDSWKNNLGQGNGDMAGNQDMGGNEVIQSPNYDSTQENPNQNLTVPENYRQELLQMCWSSVHCMTQMDLDKMMSSYLIVHTDNDVDLLLRLAPLEVYSVDKLKLFRHSRVCGPPDYIGDLKKGRLLRR